MSCCAAKMALGWSRRSMSSASTVRNTGLPVGVPSSVAG
jgi:hypothetical protein